MKAIIKVGGLILLVGSIVLLKANWDSFKVQTEGEIVKMKIDELPSSCIGTKVKHYVTLSYDNEIYVKRISRPFCEEHKVGDYVDVKILSGYSIVLFPQESAVSNLLAFGAVGLIGLIILVKSFLK